MTVDSVEVVWLTCQFVLPGYIIREILLAVMPQKTISDGAQLVETLGYSVLHMALWGWLINGIQIKLGSNIGWCGLAEVVVILCTAIFTGVLLGVFRERQVFRILFQKMGIKLSHPVPTAWDYKFSVCESQWVEVTVSDGKTLRGFYSGKSFSSSDSNYRDIYLEELYIKNKDTWTKVERTSGVWINPEEIRFIKFYSLEDSENG